MKNLSLLFSIVVLAAATCFAQTSAFTYQGKLGNSGVPANGDYQFEFKLFDASGGTNQIGTTQSVPANVPTPTPAVNGKICYTNGGDIWKMDADGSNRVSVIDAGTNDIQPVWSPGGGKIAFKSDRDVAPGRGLYSVNADGTGLTLLTSGDGNADPAWSPDGTRIAFASNRDNLITSIYLMNPDGSNVTRLTNQLPFSDAGPVWSPDGTRMVFETNQGLGSNIGIINLDGTGRAVIGAGQFPAWSPDGAKIIFSRVPPAESSYQLFTMNPDGSGVTQLTSGNFNDQYPAWSPDGQKIVFVRNISGTVGLWTMNADGTGQVGFANTNTIGNGYPDWQRAPNTPVGSSVTVQTSDAMVTFANVCLEGTTTFSPITPDTAQLPPGYTLCPTCQAYDIATTACYSPPVTVCLAVPVAVDQQTFILLKLMHLENNAFVDRTTGHLTDAGGARFVCGVVQSLSPFALASSAGPTAAPGLISGTITNSAGESVSGVVITLSGSEARKTITDANGFYRFDNVEAGAFYTVTPSRLNYHFAPDNRFFSLLGNMTDAGFTATRDAVSVGNVIDTPEYFVRQHYLDFLWREPDEAGFNFWSDQVLECGADPSCLERRRVNVSAAYFLSIEFQETGGLVDGLYRASYGRAPLYAEFMPDSAAVARGVIVGRNGWQQQLAANKQAFIDAWVQRSDFHTTYDGLSNDGYVDQLIAHTGVDFTASERDELVSGLTSGTLTRASALRRIVENQSFARAKFNEAFVMMQYFGYLRRDPDDGGYQFWLRKLNEFNGNFEQAEMVRAFLISGEYRQRFGTP